MDNNNNKKGFVFSRTFLIVVMLIIVVVGGTFAWFSYKSNYSALVLTIGDINDTHIILKPYQIKGTMTPVNTYTSGVYSEVEVINDDTDPTLISLYYKINELDQELIDNGLKYTIASSDSEDGTYTEVKTGDFKEYSGKEEALILDANTQGNTTTYYRVYLWLDSSVGDQSVVQDSMLDVELNASISQNAGAPVLSDGMIPVVIANNGEVKTISSTDENWYDYGSKKWANVVLVNSSSRSSYENTTDKVVNNSDILAYYVWIPRFKYKIWTTGVSSVGSENKIDVVFEKYNDSMSLGTNVGTYRTHPAFWFDGDNDGTVDTDETLAGIWVGKFETTGSVSNPTILPGVTPIHSQNVSSLFNSSLKFSNGSLNTGTGKVTFFDASDGYELLNTTYGLGIEVDSHMAKNSEWGAVTYLAHSGFGINKEVDYNYAASIMTGCGLSTDGSSCSNKYGTGISEYSQSTTGNITGVFDLSGGTYEYVMGNFNGQKGSSGFSVLPDSKYYNLYTSNSCTVDSCGGHAINETSGWYNDESKFVTTDNPWFIRGGGNTGSNSVGMFAISNANGGNGNSYSMRSVLVNLPSYKINYNMNNGVGSIDEQTKVYGVDLTLSNYVPTRIGYKFLGWGTSASDTTVNFQSGGSYTDDTGINLFAVWQANTYTINYDYKGGNVTTANTTSYNVNTNTITLNNPTKTGADFLGYTENISTNDWSNGYIDSSNGNIQSYNSSYPNSVYSELIYLEKDVVYTLSGTNLGRVRWVFYNTSGTYVSVGSENTTFTPSQNGYVRILLYDGCTETNRNAAIITSDQGTSVSIVKGSTGNRNYVANWHSNSITFDNQVFTIDYTGSQQTKGFNGAENGGGNYSYQISGTGSTYFSISGSNLVISASAPANTYNLTVTATDNDSSITQAATFTVTINKKVVTISWGSTTQWGYDGTSHVPTASVNTGITGEVMTLNVTGGQTNVGSYTATASCKSVSGGQANCNNYTLTGTTKAFTIVEGNNQITGTTSTMYVQATLDISTLISNAKGTLSYTIKSQTTTSSSLNGKTLTAGVLSSSNDNNGSVVVTVTDDGGSNYKSSSVDVTITVQKYTRTLTWNSATPSSVTYGDTSKSATVSVTGTGGTAGTVSYSSGSTGNLTINSSTGALTPVAYSTGVTITANLSRTTTVKAASVTKSIAVARATGYVNLSATSGSITYGTASKTFTVSSHYGGTLSVTDNNNTASSSVSGTTVTIGSLGAINAGTSITVTVTSAQTTQYNSASATYTLTINKADLRGSVKITGTNTVGQTLTADVTNTDNAALSYQWWYSRYSSGTSKTNISGATGSTYTLPNNSTYIGKYIGVTVTATKTNYNNATWTDVTDSSNGTATLQDVQKYRITFDACSGTGAPVQQEKTHGIDLTLSSTKPTRDEYTFDGWALKTGTVNSCTAATSATYQPGGKYTSNADATFYAVWTYTPSCNAPTAVTITGTNTVGQTLTANVTNTDGYTLSYQWKYKTSSYSWAQETNIVGATGSTYTIDDDHVGRYIIVSVTATKNGCSNVTLTDTTDTSNGSATVENLPSVPLSVTITGTNTVGQTLTANVTNSTNATLSYQWWYATRSTATSGTNISGATSSTYTLPNNSTYIGKYIGVTVTGTKSGYSNGTDTDITDTSNGTATLQAAPTCNAPTAVTITGTNTVGETLTASVTNTDGYTLSYQWWSKGTGWFDQQSNINGATNSSYTLTSTHVGSTIGVIVTATKSGCDTVTLNDSTDTSNGSATVQNATPALSCSVNITGINTVGQKLTASVTNPNNASLSYKWWYSTSATATTGTNITNATSSSYTLTSTHADRYIGVTVTATQSGTSVTCNDITDATNNESATVRKTYTVSFDACSGSGAPASQTKTHGVDLTIPSTTPSRTGYTFEGWALKYGTVNSCSAATSATYQPGTSKYTSNADATFYAVWTSTPTCNAPTAVTITGTNTVGETLTASVTNTDNYTLAYQWWTSTSSLAYTKTNINGATSSTYTLTSNEQNKYVGVTVTATKSGCSNATLTDTTSAKISAATSSTLSGSVKITGTNTVGQKLTASVTNTNSATLAYQWWYSTSATATSGTNINGATSSTYTLTSTHEGKYIGVTVTATKTGYTTATWNDITDATNNSTATVKANSTTSCTAPTAVTITGTNTVGQTLTASVTNTDNYTLAYQWWTSTSSLAYTKTNISGATSSSYTLTSNEQNKYVGVTVTATKSGCSNATLTDTTSAKISAATSSTLSGSVKITGTNTVGQKLTASVTNTNSATLAYQWWYSSSATATSGTNISGATSSTYTLTSTHEGKYIGVTVTATKTGYTTATWNDITDATNNSTATVKANSTTSCTAPTAVTITGTNTVGQKLTASVINTDNYTLTYQWWYTSSSWSSSGTSISGATSSTYTLTSTHQGKYIGVTVTATKTGCSNVTLTDKADATNNGTDTVSAGTQGPYTVSYNACSGSGAPASQQKIHGTDLTLSSTKPSRTGYTFAGWALNASSCTAATTATHQPGGKYTSNADATFYAVWTSSSSGGGSGTSSTVTFVGNMFSPWMTYWNFSDATDGYEFEYDISTSIATLNGLHDSGRMLGFTETSFKSGDKYDIKLEYVSGSVSSSSAYKLVTEVYNSNMKQLSSRNYVDSSFPASGSSTQTLTISSTAASSGKFLHFRIFKTSGSTATFNNYKVKITVTKQSTATVTSGGKYTLPSDPVRNGYTFKGWYTAESGGTKISSTSTVSATSNHSLYAQWTQKSLKVNYDANGGSGSMSSVSYTFADPTEWQMSTSTFTPPSGKKWQTWRFYNPTLGLWWGCTDVSTVNCGNTNPTFGWYKASDIVNYYNNNWAAKKGTSNTMGYDINLVAQWEDGSYTVSYDACSGTGAPSSQTKTHGTDLTLSSTKPTRTGYTFKGWALKSSTVTSCSTATSATHQSGGKYTVNANATFYAVWESAVPTVTTISSYSCANGTSGSSPYTFTFSGNCEVISEGSKGWRIKLLTDGDFVSGKDMAIDVFLVGGGGGGGNNYTYGGGGGGYTTTSFANLKSGTPYKVDIGDGGAAAKNGSNTTGFNSIAFGGNAGGSFGGTGGSGGAGRGGNGGSDGSNGVSGTTTVGMGQGTTTREFGESSGTLYSGGGSGSGSGSGTGGSGGGASGTGVAASSNTGGGGGGGGGAGGSGIVVIRNTRINLSDASKLPTVAFDFTYANGYYAIENEGSGNWKIKFLTDGTFKSNSSLQIDAFLVGGGGGGGNNYTYGGGGGGYTTTSSISVVSGTSYVLDIGDGGVSATDGEDTKAFNLIASGGSAGTSVGGSGGSGGGGTGGAGGSNGGAGAAGTGTGGTGQGTTTREFGESTGKLYAGGGGGGGATSGVGGAGGGGYGRNEGITSAVVNSGGGGGGSSDAGTYRGGGGGSGIIIIRNKR